MGYRNGLPMMLPPRSSATTCWCIYPLPIESLLKKGHEGISHDREKKLQSCITRHLQRTKRNRYTRHSEETCHGEAQHGESISSIKMARKSSRRHPLIARDTTRRICSFVPRCCRKCPRECGQVSLPPIC